MLQIAPLELVVPDSVLLYNVNWDGQFPYIFQVDSHPLVHDHNLLSPGRILMYIQDTSVEGLEALEAFEASLEVPLGPNDSVSNLGATRLHADDPSVLKEMIHVQCLIVGNEAFTKLGRPVKANGVWIGGTTWEHCNGLSGVKGSQCYTLGPSHQCSRQLVLPTASAKVADHTLDEHQELHHDIVKITGKVGMVGIQKHAPVKFVQHLELLAEATNMPRIGVLNNCAYPTIQLNLASAIQRGWIPDMGHFGQKNGHIDQKDDPGAETAMLSLIAVPADKGYESGRFNLLSMGLYIKLDLFKLTGFSGLCKHGGTPPLSPPGKPLADSACRIMVVMYPPASMLSQSANHRAGSRSLQNGKIFTLAPEMTSVL
ncbi:hypothetical protein L208DRAFT_1246992 [Tricholoma matsutake]|nr:hypothetical protein L208DRAFT_1246992 [Tricholoma matsutake 945]